MQAHPPSVAPVANGSLEIDVEAATSSGGIGGSGVSPTADDDSSAKGKGKRAVVAMLRTRRCCTTSPGKLLLGMLTLAVVFAIRWRLRGNATVTDHGSTVGPRAGPPGNDSPQGTAQQQQPLQRAQRREEALRQREGRAAASSAAGVEEFDAAADADICTELGLDGGDAWQHGQSTAAAAAVPLLHNNASVAGLARAGQYAYFHLCIDNTRDYHHVVEIFLDPVAPPALPDGFPGRPGGTRLQRMRGNGALALAAAADVDMYLSAHIPRPTIQESTWITAKTGPDHIRLSTDLNDWAQSSRVLHIGVLSRKADTPFTIRPLVYKKEGSHRGTDPLIGPDTIHRRGRRAQRPRRSRR